MTKFHEEHILEGNQRVEQKRSRGKTIVSRSALYNMLGKEIVETLFDIAQTSGERVEKLRKEWEITEENKDVVNSDRFRIEEKFEHEDKYLDPFKSQLDLALEDAKLICDPEKTPYDKINDKLDKAISAKIKYLEAVKIKYLNSCEEINHIASKFDDYYDLNSMGSDVESLRNNLKLLLEYEKKINYLQNQVTEIALLVSIYKLVKREVDAESESSRAIAVEIANHISKSYEYVKNSSELPENLVRQSQDRVREIEGKINKLAANSTKAAQDKEKMASDKQELAQRRLQDKVKSSPSRLKRFATWISGGRYKGGIMPNLTPYRKAEIDARKEHNDSKRNLKKITNFFNFFKKQDSIRLNDTKVIDDAFVSNLRNDMDKITSSSKVNEKLQERYVLDGQQKTNPAILQTSIVEQLNQQLMLGKLIAEGLAQGTNKKPEEYLLMATKRANEEFSPPIVKQIIGAGTKLGELLLKRKNQNTNKNIADAFDVFNYAKMQEFSVYFMSAYCHVGKDGSSPIDKLTAQGIQELCAVAVSRIMEAIGGSNLTVEQLESEQSMQHLFKAVINQDSQKGIQTTPLDTINPNLKLTAEGFLDRIGVIKDGKEYAHKDTKGRKYGAILLPQGVELRNKSGKYILASEKDKKELKDVLEVLETDAQQGQDQQTKDQKTKDHDQEFIRANVIKLLLLKQRKKPKHLSKEEKTDILEKSSKITKSLVDFIEEKKDSPLNRSEIKNKIRHELGIKKFRDLGLGKSKKVAESVDAIFNAAVRSQPEIELDEDSLSVESIAGNIETVLEESGSKYKAEEIAQELARTAVIYQTELHALKVNPSSRDKDQKNLDKSLEQIVTDMVDLCISDKSKRKEFVQQFTTEVKDIAQKLENFNNLNMDKYLEKSKELFSGAEETAESEVSLPAAVKEGQDQTESKTLRQKMQDKHKSSRNSSGLLGKIAGAANKMVEKVTEVGTAVLEGEDIGSAVQDTLEGAADEVFNKGATHLERQQSRNSANKGDKGKVR